MHKSYEELCALAATGQITGDAMKVLDRHVKECSSCRAFLKDLVPLKAHVTPVVAASRMHTYIPPEGIRERFLQKAAAAGVDMHPGLPMEVPALDRVSMFESRSAPLEQMVGSGWRNWILFTPRFALPVLAGLLCGILGFVIARQSNKPTPTQVAVAPAIPNPPAHNDTAAQIALLHDQYKGARDRIASLASDLADAQAEKRQLETQLADLSRRTMAGEQFEHQFREVSAKLEDAEIRATKLQSDLETERSRATTAEVVSLAQQKATEDANSKVAVLETQLDHLRELDSGKSQAGDLISARNLHIVDVYDTESNGERKRAFGRVFFVEGKSLVFYAYDLPESERGTRKVEFRVWGEQAGASTVSINLGAMHTENPSQGRWVLTCDDPKVLNRINAVYLTADSNPHPDTRPRGAKLMYAFLGSPNHP